ncbi:MAG: hypothetical protein WCW87_00765 [Candidatus Paceibacterota bacterium]
MENHCKTCGGATEGYKCDVCGDESSEHIEEHPCGNSHNMPKCAECNEAEIKCSCKAE